MPAGAWLAAGRAGNGAEPLPGAQRPGMEKLAKKNVVKVIDLLSERLAFERAGVKLYDTLLSRLRLSADPVFKGLIKRVEHIRDEEKEHEEWLEEQIRDLGGDAHNPTEHTVLVMAESEGIERVVRRDENIPHELHALLTAELADNAGWDLLVQLAAEFGDSDAKKQFKKRLNEEKKHLVFVRETLLELMKQEVAAAPAGPPTE